jgi:alpha-N-arabinofuranosidase
MMRAGQVEDAIRLTEQIIGVAGFGGKLGIAFDEWNLRGWHHPAGSDSAALEARDRNDINATYTMADAIFSAGFLNTCLRHADTVWMANMAPAVNTRGPLFVHPQGVVRRTTFHVLAMYANLLGPNVADAFVAGPAFAHDGLSVPAVDAVATCNSGQESWRIALVNRFPDRALPCQLILDGAPLQGSHGATVLAGDSPDAYNDMHAPDRVAPYNANLIIDDGTISLPPHSVTILELSEQR